MVGKNNSVYIYFLSADSCQHHSSRIYGVCIINSINMSSFSIFPKQLTYEMDYIYIEAIFIFQFIRTCTQTYWVEVFQKNSASSGSCIVTGYYFPD